MKQLRELLKWSLAVMTFSLSMTMLPSPSTAQTYYPSYYLYYLLRIRYPSQLIISMPARDLNGIALNGAYLDERYVTGLSLDDVVIPGKKKTVDMALVGTQFKHPKKHVVGAIFTATLDDGSLLPVRIDAVEDRKDRVDPYVTHYLASYETDAGRQPLCGVDENGEPVKAIPLLGLWDYSEGTETGGSKIDDTRSFTFACDGFVLEKCVDAGYKPWASITVCAKRRHCESVSLAGHHQACTRMMRADFCGDGVSYTQNNLLVALYDGFGIRYDSEPWEIEAEWDEDGAVCARRDRVEALEPTCLPYLIDDDCGEPSHFGDGVLLISELP